MQQSENSAARGKDATTHAVNQAQHVPGTIHATIQRLRTITVAILSHLKRRLGPIVVAAALAHTTPSLADAQSVERSRSAALLVGLGAGRYPYSPLPGSRDSRPLRATLTAGGEAEFANDWQWLVEGQLAFSPGVCSDVCPGAGVAAAAAVQRRVIDDAPERIGIAFGPALFYTDFNGAEAGAGVRMDFGVLRGVGPRLGVQYGRLSGGHDIATVHVMLRLRN